MLKEFLETKKIELPVEALSSLLNANKNTFIFVKNDRSIYQYANTSFLRLMGLKDGESIHHRLDSDLCRDKNKVKIYLQDDERVLDSKLALDIREDVLPIHNPGVTKNLVGTLFPLLEEKGRIAGVLGIVELQNSPWCLTMEAAVSLSAYEMEAWIQKRSYPVCVDNRKMTLSRRELQCIIGLIQGRQTREISVLLSLQPKTVEFYIENIKNKFGATSRSSLIQTIFNQKILQQIVL